jgi:hypothetical protein
MIECWNQNALERPSFKETSVFLNTQLQKLSKTISSITSFSSVTSHNELKQLNIDTSDNQNDEADDEQTADVFLNVNDRNLKILNEKKIDFGLIEIKNRQILTRSLGDASVQDSCDDTASSLIVENTENNKNVEQKNLFELITRLNLGNDQNNNDNDNFTDSNYESASSYYSSTSPNHLMNETKIAVAKIKNEDCDSPLISAKNLLVRMSNDKPFYMNNIFNNIKYHNEIVETVKRPKLSASSSTSSTTVSTPKILISPSMDDEDYDEFVN